MSVCKRSTLSLNEVEGAGSKPLSVPVAGDRIQLCTLPAPRRAASSGLSGLAPMGLLVSSPTWEPPSFDIIVHPTQRSFLLH